MYASPSILTPHIGQSNWFYVAGSIKHVKIMVISHVEWHFGTKSSGLMIKEGLKGWRNWMCYCWSLKVIIQIGHKQELLLAKVCFT